MNIPVFVKPDYTTFYTLKTRKLKFTNTGVIATVKKIRLYAMAKDYPLEDYPCNMATLSDAQKKFFIDSYINNDGAFLSTEAYNDAVKLNYRIG